MMILSYRKTRKNARAAESKKIFCLPVLDRRENILKIKGGAENA